MKLYKKKVDEYKNFIDEKYIKQTSIENTIRKCKVVLTDNEDSKMSYFEFLYIQSKFIKKSWWILQGIVLLLLWFVLKDTGSMGDVERKLGSLATLFAILIIPEIWKNQRFSTIEIERAAYYSLRQICAARALLFAIVDLALITIFFIVTLNTLQISIYRMIINFLIPFNVSICICFRLLYSKWNEMEYIAIIGSIAWLLVWSTIVTRDNIYQLIAEPIWIGLLLVSFAYLIFCVRKSKFGSEIAWKEKFDGIKA